MRPFRLISSTGRPICRDLGPQTNLFSHGVGMRALCNLAASRDQHEKKDSAAKLGHASMAGPFHPGETFIFAARHDRLLGVSCPSGGSLLLIVRRAAAHPHPQTIILRCVFPELDYVRSVGAPA